MTTKFYLGVDPGSSGAIAVIDALGNVEAILKLANITLRDVLDFLGEFSGSKAALEKVHASPSQDAARRGLTQKMGAKSAFTFGRSVGQLEMAMTATKLSWDYVSPMKWQKEFGLRKAFPSRQAKKRAHKEAAERIFPNIKVTLYNVDALLLAEYIRRRELTGHE